MEIRTIFLRNRFVVRVIVKQCVLRLLFDSLEEEEEKIKRKINVRNEIEDYGKLR